MQQSPLRFVINEVVLFSVFDRFPSQISDDGPDSDRKGDLVEPDVDDPPSYFIAYASIVYEAREEIDG
jgi:hypothetical protein